MGILDMSVSYKFSSYTLLHIHKILYLWVTFTGLFGHCLCVTMCNFIMYHLEIGICSKLKQIATKMQQKKPNVGAHCVAKPDINQRRKFLRRPDTNPTQGKNAKWELGFIL